MGNCVEGKCGNRMMVREDEEEEEGEGDGVGEMANAFRSNGAYNTI